MITGLIPARSGSKSIPDKNIKLLADYPLMAWSIIASKMCKAIHSTWVSTDSDDYAELAYTYGANTVNRPAEISTDTSTDMEYIKHFLSLREMAKTDIIVLLRPTTPLRHPQDIEDAISRMKQWHGDSVRSVVELKESPHKYMRIDTGGRLISCFPDIKIEYYNLRRQLFETVYHPDGYFDIIKVDNIKKGNLFGEKIIPFISNAWEIDNPEDFEYLEWRIRKYGHELCYGLVDALKTSSLLQR